METGGATVVDPEAVIVDSDAAEIRGWTAQITSGYQSGAFGDRLGTSVVVADQRDVRCVSYPMTRTDGNILEGHPWMCVSSSKAAASVVPFFRVNSKMVRLNCQKVEVLLDLLPPRHDHCSSETMISVTQF